MAELHTVQALSLADCQVPQVREVRLCVALCHSGYNSHSTSGSNASLQRSGGERTQADMHGRHLGVLDAQQWKGLD